jgi:arylsulfatase A-like enzyme
MSMLRTTFSALALVLIASCSAGPESQQSPAQSEAADARFDILFIAIDDLNDWVGHLGGHPQAQTPNIDRLAARGMAFMNAQSPSAICHAARTAILTGLRPSTSGIYGNGPDWRNQDIFRDKPTLPRFFRDHGYATHGAGKIFHAQTFTANGFAGFNDATAWDAFFPSLDRQLPDEFGPFSIPANGNNWGRSFDWAPLVAEDYALGDGQVTTWVAERILAAGDGPRFNAAGIYRPHQPWYVPESYFEQFPLDQIVLPPHIEGDLEDVPEAARRGAFNSLENHTWVLEEESRWREGVRAYLASVAYADAMVGRLLDALDSSGRADRTIIVLWGDHGFHLGEKERWQKYTLWGESLHVPFVIVAPDVTRPGTTSSAPVSLMDIYPTLAELAGLEAPAHVEGRSLVPLLADPSLPWDHPTLSTYGFGNHAVVSASHKYIRYTDGSEEFYDLVADPNEWTNLAGDEGLANIQQELASYLPAVEAPNLVGRRGGGPGRGGSGRGGGEAVGASESAEADDPAPAE